VKALMLTIFLCVALAATSCGSEDSGDATDAGSASTTTESSAAGTTPDAAESDNAGERTKAGAPTKPEVPSPSGTPPKELVIEEIEEGSGPEAKKGDKVTVHFVADDEAGKEAFSTWPGDNPGKQLAFELGGGKYSQAFEEGTEGMKAGGRRELSVPAKQAQYTKSALLYVIDLIAVE
jgi:peptidylprolyl isomerase